MTERAYTITRATGSDQVVHVTWAAMANGDVGSPFKLNAFSERCVQAIGTFGSGGNVQFQGSNELVPTNWFALSDASSTTIALQAATTGKQVLEGPLWIRPKVTAGDGTTALTPQFIGRQLWKG